MPDVSSQAILLRRIDYGDNDLIVTLFTPQIGRLAVIAKSAKKSKKRFPGILELFSLLTVVYSESQRKGLPILKEAALQDAFLHIRTDILKTGYAGYWVELVNVWLQEGQAQPELYQQLLEVLCALDRGEIPARILSIYYQMKFLTAAGLTPHLDACSLCQVQSDQLPESKFRLSLKDGGLVCCDCTRQESAKRTFTLSKGTLKQLVWMSQRSLATASRVRFSASALEEALDFLEAFVPYHIGKVPKSLTFIKRLRD